jgi:hypothetical protein
MDKLIYTLCALTALLCTVLLARAYGAAKHRLLLWSAACFAGLTVTNVLLVLDKTVFVEVDLSTWRLLIALISMILLVAGLLLEEEK